VNAIVARQIDYGCDPVLGPLGQIRAGNVKALAVAATARSALLPDVPTSYEQGVPAFDCAPFYAMFAPKGTPKAVIDRIAAAMTRGLSEEAVQKRMADLGAAVPEPARRGPKPLADVVASEIARLGPVLREAAK
jgi:tripartite-type tricarboxylate transporter receptor subunit TctC